MSAVDEARFCRSGVPIAQECRTTSSGTMPLDQNEFLLKTCQAER
jgi:hypothetical protein